MSYPGLDFINVVLYKFTLLFRVT